MNSFTTEKINTLKFVLQWEAFDLVLGTKAGGQKWILHCVKCVCLRLWSLSVMPRKRHRDRDLYILEYKTKNNISENKEISHL